MDRIAMKRIKRPSLIDLHIGRMMRMRRRELQISRADLGAHLGVTYQQIQRYEKGTSRISAVRLYHVCTILKVPFAYMFGHEPG
jgi:transcriptional regulator with XRE-family HTH domain